MERPVILFPQFFIYPVAFEFHKSQIPEVLKLLPYFGFDISIVSVLLFQCRYHMNEIGCGKYLLSQSINFIKNSFFPSGQTAPDVFRSPVKY